MTNSIKKTELEIHKKNITVLPCVVVLTKEGC